jgi:glycopeptide antibiotics resistance protein
MTRIEKPPVRDRARVLLATLFVVYLVLLVWLVLFKFETPWIGSGELRPIKLVPFVASGDNGSSAWREVVANIAFFVPFGIYLALLAPTWRWFTSAAVFAGASVLLEGAQYLLIVGSADITDVITNTAGGLIGVGLVALVRRRMHARTTTVMARICLIGTVVAVLLAGVFLASPLHYGPMKDAGRLSHDRAEVLR